MTRSTPAVLICSLAVTLVPTDTLQAQDSVTRPFELALAQRGAQADCLRKLAAAVYGLQITPETRVFDLASEGDKFRSGIEAFILRTSLQPPRHHPDGACFVDATIKIKDLAEELRKLTAQYAAAESPPTGDFKQIVRLLETDRVRATGTGIAKPRLRPDSLPGTEAAITDLPMYAWKPLEGVPPIWEASGSDGRIEGHRAARIHAAQMILKRIKRLRLTPDWLVGDWLNQSDELAAEASGLVEGTTQVDPAYYLDHQLIVIITMELPVETIVSRLEALHREHDTAKRVTAADFRKLGETLEQPTIQATGTGVPSKKFIDATIGAGFAMPDWFGRTLTATGRGRDPSIASPDGRTRAARAAELDALRLLAEQIAALPLSSTLTVGAFVGTHRSIGPLVHAITAPAPSSAPRYAQGVAEVSLSVPAAEVWAVVHEQRLIDARK